MSYAIFFVLIFSCAENKEQDFSFSVSSGSTNEDLEETAEEQETEAQEPESTISEPRETPEPEDTEEEPCAIPPESAEIPPVDLTGRVDCGEDVYMQFCANCHGLQGQGAANGQALQGHIQGHSDTELIQSIVYGEGDMPPQNLENQEVADVIAYMRANF